MSVFHTAIGVLSLAETREFYADVLGCETGRSTDHWIDFNFFGHQLSAHLCKIPTSNDATSEVDGVQVPMRHFGAILEWAEWENLVAKLRAHGTKFIIEPQVRYKGKVGEQATMFFLDPSGNALEFKAFRNKSEIFAV